MSLNQNQLIKYGIQAETEFLFALNDKINDTNIIIKKTEDRYAPVDFTITNNTNDTILYIELKSRKIDISKFKTFLIGRSKINTICNTYPNSCVLIVWTDVYKHLYYKLVTKDMLKSNIQNCNGADCFLIDKNTCKDSDIASLAECIKKYHNRVLPF